MTKRLGRGLAEIIDPGSQGGGSFVLLKTEQIRTGRFQPRNRIQEEGLEELKASIKRSGVIEPVIVRPVGHGTFELVAGERRFRATQQLGMADIPAIIKTLSDKEALEFSLIENIQRENLNPVEEARGYAKLLDEYGYTQESLAEAVGKDRSTIANMLRLLTLPEEICRGLSEGAITMGHAKALLSIGDHGKQVEVYRQTVSGIFSVRQVEALAGTLAPAKRRKARRVDPQVKALEDELRRTLGTKVTLVARSKGGRIVIEYFSGEDLERILQALGVAGADGR